jgi:elongation factor Ts
MSNVTAEQVKDLRERTGAGMADCKKALTETGGDLEKAVEELRKKGIAAASKKTGRLASEGLLQIAREGNVTALVEVNCETDFVAKTDDFQNFIKQVAGQVVKNKPASLEALLQQTSPEGKSWEERTKELIAKLGENISIRRFALVELKPGERLGHYLHMGSKIGAVVKVKGEAAKLSDELLKELAMHAAAAGPRFLNREQIPEEVVSKEKEIYRAQMKDSGKSPEILEKILSGKLEKFAAEVCFEEQLFIKDPTGKTSVARHLKSADPTARLVEFVRFQVGEGMAKKEEDFAAEVAKQLGK